MNLKLTQHHKIRKCPFNHLKELKIKFMTNGTVYHGKNSSKIIEFETILNESREQTVEPKPRIATGGSEPMSIIFNSRCDFTGNPYHSQWKMSTLKSSKLFDKRSPKKHNRKICP